MNGVQLCVPASPLSVAALGVVVGIVLGLVSRLALGAAARAYLLRALWARRVPDLRLREAVAPVSALPSADAGVDVDGEGATVESLALWSERVR